MVAACLSPAPTEALAAALGSVPLAVTVEAHYLSGGLGSLVSEVVAESGLALPRRPLRRRGPPDVRRERGVPQRRARPVGEGDRANGDRGARPARQEPPDRRRRPMKKLSAVIACYRDAPAIPEMYARLTETFRSIGVDYEIIFVNDASPDNAREVLAELAASDPRVVVVNHTRNFGSQSAFTSGLRIATGDAAILLDGDLQDPPELIAEFHEKWLEGWDVVYGVRVRRVTTLPMRIALQGVLPPVPGHGIRLRSARRRRLLPARPPRHRRAQRAARVRPVHARPARVGRLPADRRPVRPAGAPVRHVDELARPEHRLGAASSALVLLRAARSHRLAGVRHRRRLRGRRGIAQIVLRFVDPSLAPKGFTSTPRRDVLPRRASSSSAWPSSARTSRTSTRRSSDGPAYIVESVLNAPASESAGTRPRNDVGVDERRRGPYRPPRRTRHEAPRRVAGGRW